MRIRVSLILFGLTPRKLTDVPIACQSIPALAAALPVEEFHEQDGLFTPGPTSVPEEVLLEMAKPVFHHRTQQYKDLFAKCNEMLKYTYQTKNPVLTISGSGTAGAEMAMINTIPAGGSVLFLSNGKFAERWVKIGDRNKWNATVLKAEYGQAVPVQQVADALKAKHYDAVVLVHSETSSCTVTDLAGIAALTKDTDTILISDGITAIGAIPVKTDEWGVDVVITGSQKALMLPPGLAFISVSEKAQKKAAAIKQPNLYLDLNSYLKSFNENDVPWTPAVTLVRGLFVALSMIQQETIEAVWKRTAIYASATRGGPRLGPGRVLQEPVGLGHRHQLPGRLYRQGIPRRSPQAAQHERGRRPGYDGRQDLPHLTHGLHGSGRYAGRRPWRGNHPQAAGLQVRVRRGRRRRPQRTGQAAGEIMP